MSQQSVNLLEALSAETQRSFVDGARDTLPVRGLTHSFYKYPARFSPSFARAAIETFTKPGDFVLDPHVGGATSLVEALALGRSAIGVDISSLAEFVSLAKTTLYAADELDALAEWASIAPEVINPRRFSIHFASYEEQGYYRHLEHPSRWRLRKAIEQSLGAAIGLRSEKLETFARCVILRTAQWALDGRRHLPSLHDFRKALVKNAEEMIAGARTLGECPKVGPAALPACGVLQLRWPSASPFATEGERPCLRAELPTAQRSPFFLGRGRLEGTSSNTMPAFRTTTPSSPVPMLPSNARDRSRRGRENAAWAGGNGLSDGTLLVTQEETAQF